MEIMEMAANFIKVSLTVSDSVFTCEGGEKSEGAIHETAARGNEAQCLNQKAKMYRQGAAAMLGS